MRSESIIYSRLAPAPANAKLVNGSFDILLGHLCQSAVGPINIIVEDACGGGGGGRL